MQRAANLDAALDVADTSARKIGRTKSLSAAAERVGEWRACSPRTLGHKRVSPKGRLDEHHAVPPSGGRHTLRSRRMGAPCPMIKRKMQDKRFAP